MTLIRGYFRVILVIIFALFSVVKCNLLKSHLGRKNGRHRRDEISQDERKVTTAVSVSADELPSCRHILSTHPPKPNPTPSSRTFFSSSKKAKIETTYRIDGGSLINPDLAQYMAAIHFRNVRGFEGDQTNNKYVCVGTKIDRNLVLTTTSCVFNYRSDEDRANITVYIGSTNSNPVNGVPHRVKQLIFQNTSNDVQYGVALLSLFPNYDRGDEVPPKYMSVNENDRLPLPRAVVRTVGFAKPNAYTNEELVSRQQSFENVYGSLFRQVDLPVTSFERCKTHFDEVESTTYSFADHLCVGYISSNCGLCDGKFLGDGGAPLFQYNSDGLPVLVGLFKHRKCDSNTLKGADSEPGLFLRISPFVQNFLRPLSKNITVTNTTESIFVAAEEVLLPSPTPSRTPKPSSSRAPSPTPSNSTSPRPEPKGSNAITVSLGVLSGLLFLVLVIITALYLRRNRTGRFHTPTIPIHPVQNQFHPETQFPQTVASDGPQPLQSVPIPNSNEPPFFRRNEVRGRFQYEFPSFPSRNGQTNNQQGG